MRIAKALVKTSSVASSQKGFTSIDMLISSSLISTVVALSSQLSNTSLDATQASVQKAKIDSAIASRIEEIREVSFYHLCEKSTASGKEEECNSDHINRQKYDLAKLQPFCSTNTLGNSLLQELSSKETDLTGDFYLNDYDSNATATLISTNAEASGNLLKLTFSSEQTTQLSTVIVPHAQGWCA